MRVVAMVTSSWERGVSRASLTQWFADFNLTFGITGYVLENAAEMNILCSHV